MWPAGEAGGAAHAGRAAGRVHVAGLERQDVRRPREQVRDVHDHIDGTGVLLLLAVVPELHLKLPPVGQLVGGGDARSHRAERGVGLALHPLFVAAVAGAQCRVNHDGVAEDVAQRVLGRHALRPPADDEGDLALVVEAAGGKVAGRERERVLRPGDRAGGLQEEAERVGRVAAGPGPAAELLHHLVDVRAVVGRRGEQVHRRRVGRAEPDRVQRLRRRGGGRRLHARSQRVPARDQPVHGPDIARLPAGHHVAHLVDPVVAEHADAVVVERYESHLSSRLARWLGPPAGARRGNLRGLRGPRATCADCPTVAPRSARAARPRRGSWGARLAAHRTG